MLLKSKDLKLEMIANSKAFPQLKKLKPGNYSIKLHNKEYILRQSKNKLFFNNTENSEKDNIREFLAVSEEYDSFYDKIARKSCFFPLKPLKGLKILHAPFFETVVLHILSSNNDKERVCFLYKTLCDITGDGFFPEPEALQKSSVSYLAKNGFGRQAEAIIDFADLMVKSPALEEELKVMTDIDLKSTILGWPGCGDLISEEIMLYALKRYYIFPGNQKILARLTEMLPAETDIHDFLNQEFAADKGMLYFYLEELLRQENKEQRKRKKH